MSLELSFQSLASQQAKAREGSARASLARATSLVSGVAGPGRATPLLVLGQMLLLLVVDLHQVLLHAGGDLGAQVPDEHTAAKTGAQSRATSMRATATVGPGPCVTMAKILPHRCPIGLV